VSFRLTRTGLVEVDRAEAAIEEMVFLPIPPPDIAFLFVNICLSCPKLFLSKKNLIPKRTVKSEGKETKQVAKR